jgi:hypothetical protein
VRTHRSAGPVTTGGETTHYRRQRRGVRHTGGTAIGEGTTILGARQHPKSGASVGPVWDGAPATLWPVWGKSKAPLELGPYLVPVWGLSGVQCGACVGSVWGQPGNYRRPICGQSGASLGQTQFSLWPHTVVWGTGLGPAWDQSGAQSLHTGTETTTDETIPGGASGGASGGTTGGTATGEGTITGGTTQGAPAILMKVGRHDTLAPRCTRKQSVGGR